MGSSTTGRRVGPLFSCFTADTERQLLSEVFELLLHFSYYFRDDQSRNNMRIAGSNSKSEKKKHTHTQSKGKGIMNLGTSKSFALIK